MTPLELCPVCYGLHRNPPTCLGRPQTDREWMIDRGVRPERIDVILATRERYSAETGHKYPPMATPPTQEALF